VIDLHTHILPGLDDGVRSVGEARELAAESVAAGVATLAATPHVRADLTVTSGSIAEGVAVLRRDLEKHQIALTVVTGAEVAAERVAFLPADEIARLTLAGTGRYVLLECPYTTGLEVLSRAVRSLRSRGMTAIVAHPERNPQIQDDVSIAERLFAAGGLLQITSSSLLGSPDGASRGCAQALLARRLVHVVASDAHRPQTRRRLDYDGLVGAVGPTLARFLVVDSPAAILAGRDLPAHELVRAPGEGE
jgi:protein-tyrosine phosphatase